MSYKSLVNIFLLTSVTLLTGNFWIAPAWSQDNQEIDKQEKLEANPNLQDAQEGENVEEMKETAPAKMAFVCGGLAGQPPVTYAYTEGKIELIPLFRWDAALLPEDLAGDTGKLCQETAAKLQQRYQQGKPIFLGFAQKNDRNLVCLVSNPEASCNADDSEELFSVEYSQERKINPECITDYQPAQCSASSRPALSIPDKSYKPMWWPF